MTINKKVLVLAAHFDDELLGCGGLLHNLSSVEDVETNVAIVASNRKVGGEFDRDLSYTLQAQSEQVRKMLGVNYYHYGELPDEELHENFKEVRQYVEGLRDTIDPDIIFVQNPTDINQDHETLFKAAKIAWRLQRINKPFKLYTYEVLSSTEQGYAPFDPNYFTELSWEDIDVKGRAMKRYTSELSDARCYEGIMHLARYRGIQAGYLYAEAFKLVVGKS